MSLSKESIEKLRWLQGMLRKYPHRYDQGDWCGTQACLAGFCLPKVFGSRKVTLQFEDVPFPAKPLSYYAMEWLGIDMDQKYRLFSANWNGKARRFNRAQRDTDEQSAAKAIKRIDLFIETGGRE